MASVFRHLFISILRSRTPSEFPDIIQGFMAAHPDADWSQLHTPWRLRALMPFLNQLEHSKALDLIPETTRFKLIAGSMLLHTRNSWLKDKIETLSASFEHEGIQSIFLKGAGRLFTTYHDNPGGRMLKDLDILVRHENLLLADKALRNIGAIEDYERYRSEEKNPALTKEFFTKDHYHYIYYLDDLQIELHWSIGRNVPPEALDMLFANLTWIQPRSCATGIPILRTEEDIVMACLNCLKDMDPLGDGPSPVRAWQDMDLLFYFSLLPLYEIIRTIDRHQNVIEWRRTQALARALGKEYLVLTFILIAFKASARTIPNALLEICGATPLVRAFIAGTATIPSDNIS